MTANECDKTQGPGVFEERRRHLRMVAYRMLGSLSEAEDAVQEAWLRLNRSDSGTFENLDGWLTTVIGRVCLDMLRSRKARRQESLHAHVPDLSLSRDDRFEPERDVVIVDAVGLALLVALETLCPPERLAFVLHDMFAVPFEEIGSIVGCSPGCGAATGEPCTPPACRRAPPSPVR